MGYLLAAAFGRWMMVIPDIPITIWPPNGVILAMLLTRPYHTWVWWITVAVAGELTANLIWFQNPLHWALGYVVANVASILTAAMPLAFLFRGPLRRFEQLPQVLAFLVIGVLAAPMISATLGSAIDVLVGKNPFLKTWPVWWLGDATGILIAAPLVMTAINAWQETARPRLVDVVEGGVIALVLLGLTAWELSSGAAFAFLLPLPVLWAALRFEFRGVCLAVLGFALAIGAHAQTFQVAEVSEAVAALMHTRMQTLLLVAASTGLIVAAIIRQQRRATSDLARANSDLEARVLERTLAIAAAERRFKATFENAGVGITIFGGDGRLMEANDMLARMLGYDPEEMEGRSINDITHPEDRYLVDEAWNRLETGAADEYDLEKRYIRKDGSVVWGHTTVSCVRDTDGKIDYLIKIIQDITLRKQSEEARRILAREVHHRSKNLLTIVQIIARQMAVRSSPQEFVKSFGDRLQALAANQDLLIKSAWQPADLADLVKSQVHHFGEVGNRVLLTGPRVSVPPSAAQPIGMALHELATNATKYGALSNDAGLVEISWGFDEDTFRMSWREKGGPAVTQPESFGFGTTVLDRMAASSLSGEVSIEYPPTGVTWHLTCPISALRVDDGDDASN
ncbi:PAS domain S-box-containing protein [Vannielia litorea]|uniref:histidine kinase n=2 Tax=Vannielia litorea TaxID=1217970 RepID=A0A1N6IEG9_9RHOB|nr:PAS domain S-box-containing protein [Vannielia litorea]